ncbi:MAG TPA: hypothetical protein DHS57_08150 [Erysipelotrichaceae bacterium]|nr:hypothetical protein [Erysipelotrichaceae bacterium]
MQTKSTLKISRILITAVLFFTIPTVSKLFNILIEDMTISYCLAISIVAFIFIVYNWDLFALHYNRSKKNIPDTIFYTIVGVVLLGVLTYINQNFIKGYILLCDEATLKNYIGGAPILIISHSFSFSICMMIAYKSIIDRIKIAISTELVILFSGLFFGLLYTIFYVPFDLDLMITSFLYYSIFFIISSYLYNQSGSFIPAMIAITLVMAYLNLILFI